VNYWKASEEIHKHFSKLPGSEHIATKSAVYGLTKWLIRERPAIVLEIGAGIGTLTFAAIKTLSQVHVDKTYRLVCLEDNDFCLKELRNNLRCCEGRYSVVADMEQASKDIKEFDFVITDGRSQTDRTLFSRLAASAVVFVEGDRSLQMETLKLSLNSRKWIHADIRTLRRTGEVGKMRWDGGYRVVKLEPSSIDRLVFSFLNLRTSFVYRIRRIFAIFNK
jgi:hypothetical protein